MNDTTPEFRRRPDNRRTTLVFTIWPEITDDSDPIWRGVLETIDGHRHYFHTPDGLLRLLAQLSGWPDTAP